MENSVINTNKKDMVVVLISLKVCLFSTASINNIDLEIKPSLATTFLHGTAASINQHPTYCHLGADRQVLPLSDTPPIVTSSTLTMDLLWLDNQNNSSWTLFHSQVKNLKLTQHQDKSVMLPLWQDDSKSPAMIKHLFNVLIQTTSYLNLGQTAVVGLDQPLYAVAKRTQWLLLNEYGQNKIPLMLCALCIEMVMLSCIGNLLEDSTT